MSRMWVGRRCGRLCVGAALRVDYPDVGEIARESVDVESVSDDEFVGYGESYVFRIDVVAACFRLIEECRYLDRSGIHGLEVIDESADGGAGVDDVLHDDDVASGYVFAQAYNLFYYSGG